MPCIAPTTEVLESVVVQTKSQPSGTYLSLCIPSRLLHLEVLKPIPLVTHRHEVLEVHSTSLISKNGQNQSVHEYFKSVFESLFPCSWKESTGTFF